MATEDEMTTRVELLVAKVMAGDGYSTYANQITANIQMVNAEARNKIADITIKSLEGGWGSKYELVDLCGEIRVYVPPSARANLRCPGLFVTHSRTTYRYGKCAPTSRCTTTGRAQPGGSAC